METMLIKASKELVKVMDKTVDENLPKEIANVIKFHSKGAAVAGVAGGWVPGVGGTAALVAAGGFVWTMYARINKEIDLPFSENIIKSLASGVATNLVSYAVGAVVASTALSFLPGIGNVSASVISGGLCYALTLASGFVYLKVLTKLFKSGEDPSKMTAEKLKKMAKTVVQNENIKAVMKEAKNSYKAARDRGEIQDDKK